MFKGILLRELDGKVSAALEDIDEAQLPAGDVTVDVQYSTLNYKDAVSYTHLTLPTKRIV